MLSRRHPIGSAQVASLTSLVLSGALTEWQAELLAARWPEIGDRWAAEPWFKSVPEHSRAYIERSAAAAKHLLGGTLTANGACAA